MQLDMDALPAMISQRLQELGLSVREGSRRCGISYGNMSSILYGRSKRPSPELLEKIATGLDMSYPHLALAAYGIVHPPSMAPVLAAPG